MGWLFQDQIDSQWKPVADSDPIYSVQNAGDTYTGQKGWMYGDKSLEGQNYMYQPDEEGGEGPMDIKPIVPEWVSKYNKEMADFASVTKSKYGTQFLDLVKEAIDRVKGASPYEAQTKGYVDELGTAFQGYKNAPQTIEQIRQDLPQQYLAGMRPMKDYFQNAMENSARRGILNSSITGQALGTVQNELNRNFGGAVRDANLWAGQQTLAHQKELPAQVQNILASLNNLDKYWLAKELGWGQLAGTGQQNVNDILRLGGQATSNELNAAQLNNINYQTLLPLLFGGRE